MFLTVREAHWKYIIGFYLLSLFLISFMVIYLYDNTYYNWLQETTLGLINLNLLTSLIITLVTIFLWLFVLSPLKPDDLGLVEIKIRLQLAIALYIAFWSAMQISILLYLFFSGYSIKIASIWTEDGVLLNIGKIIGHLFGNAVYEELGFRAFLFPQIWIKLRKVLPSKTASVLSLLISQGLFSLLHIPIRIYNDDPIDLVSLLFLLSYGLVLCGIYYRTRNIFIAVGVHALLNFNFPLFESDGFDFSIIFFLVLLITLFFYPKIESKFRNSNDLKNHERYE